MGQQEAGGGEGGQGGEQGPEEGGVEEEEVLAEAEGGSLPGGDREAVPLQGEAGHGLGQGGEVVGGGEQGGIHTARRSDTY